MFSKRAIGLFSVGAAFVVSLCCYSGLLIFERLGGCDPKASGLLQADDQLLPAYVALSAAELPGLLGIFVAGVFGAALRYLFQFKKKLLKYFWLTSIN